MNIKRSTLWLAMVFASSTVFAYSPEEREKECHKPKFTDFTLTEYKAPENIETPAESEFSFKLPAWTNPESIKLTAKKKPLPFTIESNSSFHKITSKIPAEFTGKFLRLDSSAKVIDGECHQETGWLLKIADKVAVPAAPTETALPASAPAAATETAPTETAPPASAPAATEAKSDSVACPPTDKQTSATEPAKN